MFSQLPTAVEASEVVGRIKGAVDRFEILSLDDNVDFAEEFGGRRDRVIEVINHWAKRIKFRSIALISVQHFAVFEDRPQQLQLGERKTNFGGSIHTPILDRLLGSPKKGRHLVHDAQFNNRVVRRVTRSIVPPMTSNAKS